MYHRYSLSEITWAILRGVAQLALDLIPLINPWPERGDPPGWWWYWLSYWDWYGHRDRDNVPDRHFIESWLRGAWAELGYWIGVVGDYARDQAQDRVRSWLGYVLYGFSNFSQWLQLVYIRLGTGMVWWANSAVHALDRLYQWLPPEIRLGLTSWSSLWDRIVQRAKDWVQATYSLAISLGGQAWGWVTQTGNRLREWQDSARGLLDEFRRNPSAFILARLPSSWGILSAFAVTALPFYVSLWGQHARNLADFLADPAGWIYGKMESYLERIW